MKLILVFAVAVALWATSAAGASELVGTLPGPNVDQDAAMTGDNVYVVRDAPRGKTAVTIVSQGNPARTALLFKPKRDGNREEWFVGSGDFVAVSLRYLENFEDGSYDVRTAALAAGPAGGKMRLLSNCEPLSMNARGAVLAVITHCGKTREYRASVWILSGGKMVRKASFLIPLSVRRPRYEEGTVLGPQLSVDDRYLAIDGNRGAAVFDWSTAKLSRQLAAGIRIEKVELLDGDALEAIPLDPANSEPSPPPLIRILRFPTGVDTALELFAPTANATSPGTYDRRFVSTQDGGYLLTPHPSLSNSDEVFNDSVFNPVSGMVEPYARRTFNYSYPFDAAGTQMPIVKYGCWNTEVRTKTFLEEPEANYPICSGQVVGGSPTLHGMKLSYRFSCPQGCAYALVSLSTTDKKDAFDSDYLSIKPAKTATVTVKVSKSVSRQIRKAKTVHVEYGGYLPEQSADFAVKIH